jgi:ribosomal protein S18 acetylase RimI-like enzyme
VKIRRFESGDYAAVVDLSPRLTIGVAEWRDPAKVLNAVRDWIEESLESAHNDNRAVLVAEIDHRVVGVVTLGERGHFTGEVDGYIGELATAPDLENRRVGRALLTPAEDWVRQRGLTHLTLETGAQNRRALDFYRRSGYAEEDIRLTKRISRNQAAK